MRADVDALLCAEAGAAAALAVVVANAADDFADFVVSSHVGERVGTYRLIDVLGQGGMGTVYLAERADDAYRARVAIKFVRIGHAAPDFIRRFISERQILADLNHPFIARLPDVYTSGISCSSAEPSPFRQRSSSSLTDGSAGDGGMVATLRVRYGTIYSTQARDFLRIKGYE